MKIGIVCYPSIGGSGVLATELGHELAKAGHQVHFITYEPPFRLRLEEDNLFFHQVEMSQYELIRYPDYALALSVKIAEVAQQYELDILHAHYAVPHAISAYLARQLAGSRKPALITTLHGLILHWSDAIPPTTKLYDLVLSSLMQLRRSLKTCVVKPKITFK